MDFKILTPIVSVCALAGFVAIQLAYEYPVGLLYLFFEAESIAIFIVNVLYFIGLMIGDEYPDNHTWIGVQSLFHAICYISFSVALIILNSGEMIDGVELEVFDDGYKTKVLVGASFGLITSILLIIQFIIPSKEIVELF